MQAVWARHIVRFLCAAWLVSGAWAQTSAPQAAVYGYKGTDRDKRLLERARAEGTLNFYTSLAPTESGPLVEAFEKKTGLKVQMWRALSDGVVQRVLSESQARRHVVDVIETNGPEMESLAREQVLAEFHSPYLADLPSEIIPRHGLWVPDRLSFFVVAYNTNKVKASDVPKTYEGFLDAKWKGRVAIEATDSEWMAGLVKTWGEARGMGFMRKLADTKPALRKGHLLLAQMISAGEIDVGLTAYHANAVSFKKRGAPLDWAAVEPVIARAQGLGLARQAPHPNAALLFADFLLSPVAQEMLSQMGRTPTSRAVKSDASSMKYELLDSAVILDEAERWQQQWDRLFAAR